MKGAQQSVANRVFIMMDENDVIREVVQMCRELRIFENNYRSLSASYEELRKENLKLKDDIYYIKDILNKNIRHIDALGVNQVVIYEDNADFKKLCDVLEIPMSIDEVKE